jgi:hypothetical protein
MILKRLRDVLLIAGFVGTFILAGYVVLQPDPEFLEDTCVDQVVGGVNISRCLSNGLAKNTNAEAVRVYVGMLYQNNEKELVLDSFLLGSGEEISAASFAQSDRYTIYVYDKKDKLLLGSYSPVQKNPRDTERKIPL